MSDTRRPLLELRALSKSYGAVPVLREVDLAIRDGEFLTLLGPSGSGKTTILRIIGGFVEPDGGTVLMDGTDIVRLPINRRPFNTVFQDYALFPHMKVAANVAYGLRVRGTPSAETERRVTEVLDLVQLGGLRDRFPSELSGGQRQRVALARAIVCRPRLILLDEPLAALDVSLRRQMQHFLKSVQREIRTTFLFVTHDQEEAITMSDRICVMDQGRILQAGSAEDLYYRPESLFVARFFGDNNLIEGRVAAGEGATPVLDTAMGPVRARGEARLQPGTAAFAMLRPEAVIVGQPGASGALQGRVEFLEFGGASTLAGLRVGEGEGIPLRARLPSSARGVGLAEGQAVSVSWNEADCRLVPP